LNAVEYIKRYWWYYALLILIVLFAVYYRAGPAGQPGAISNFVIPTWGNTMYHVGIERLTMDTGHYPQQELSYGGGFPNFYVPAYRLLVVGLSTATGIDPMPMSGLVVLLLGAFCMLALYIVAYRLSGGNYWVALFAAFFFLMSPDITINTERPFPELMGLFILPMALYFVLRADWPLATLMAITMALTHQQSVLALVAILGLYSLFQLIYAIATTRKYGKFLRSCVPWIAAVCTIVLWLVYSLGSMDITKIAQLTYHEQWPVTLSTILETGTFVLIFMVIGFFYVFARALLKNKNQAAKKETKNEGKKDDRGSYRLNISTDAHMLLAAWIIGALVLTKNEWIQILSFSVNTLQSRFYTYFVDVAIILAGFGMYALLSWMDFRLMRVRPGPEPDDAADQPGQKA
jgi:hypothetical protein